MHTRALNPEVASNIPVGGFAYSGSSASVNCGWAVAKWLRICQCYSDRFLKGQQFKITCFTGYKDCIYTDTVHLYRSHVCLLVSTGISLYIDQISVLCVIK